MVYWILILKRNEREGDVNDVAISTDHNEDLSRALKEAPLAIKALGATATPGFRFHE